MSTNPSGRWHPAEVHLIRLEGQLFGGWPAYGMPYWGICRVGVAIYGNSA